MKIKALVDRFGSNRMNAHLPAELFSQCKPKPTCINVPFAGGMCEVAWFEANIINVNDLDRALINLAEMVRDRRPELVARLDATPFDPEPLAISQEYCLAIESEPVGDFGTAQDSLYDQTIVVPDPFEWAYHYFVCAWMTRGGKMGTRGQFEQGMSVRWKSTGGDSVLRFRNATEGLEEWQKVFMRRCTFHRLDCFDFLAQCIKVEKGSPRDVRENGIYADPPWPDDGGNYVHKFGEAQHRKLRDELQSFKNTRVIVRLNDHPLVRELYREPHWAWKRLTSRTQANEGKAEVLLTNWKP